MRPVTVVALTKYPDIWQAFHANVAAYVPDDVRKIAVVDGDAVTSEMASGWELIRGPEVFSMAANHNVGFRAVDADSDILNLNDDVYFLEPNPVEKFQQLAYSEPRIGCVSAHPKIGAFGQVLQQRPRRDVPLTFVKTCTNTCALFRRDALDEVGLYDESFTEKYGCEDVDYSYRIYLAGWKLAIARDIGVQHGFGVSYSSTANRAIPDKGIQNQAGVARFRAKWGHFDIAGEIPNS